MTTSNGEISDLAFIELKSDNPYDLFKNWYKEACTFVKGEPNALCLATVSKDMKVSARHVLLKDLKEDGFIIFTDNRSRKAKELSDASTAAMCFLWSYINDKNQHISRQVRIEGEMIILDKASCVDLYEKEKLFCKIRSYICKQDQEVNWNDLKVQHDQLLNEVQTENKNLPMPDHLIGYKMIPTSMEYYFARDNLIADRILFEKSSSSSSWKNKRIAA